jgi:hypothetical protein
MRRSALNARARTLRMLKGIPLFLMALILALVMVGVLNAPMRLSAATAGPNNAGTGTSVDGPGTIAWTNPGRITAPTGAPYATAALTTNATSEYLEGTNYGFAIPTDQVITGIQVSIRRMSSSNAGGNSVNDVDLYLLDAGSIVGTDHAVTTDWPTAMGVANYGATNDLWGYAWTPADINDANFGVALSVYNQSGVGNRTAFVDYIQITVTCVPPHTITASTDTGGTISPTGNVTVGEGSSQTFTVTPDATCIVSDVLVDSVSQGRMNSYTFTNVVTDHTISATFEGGWAAPTASLAGAGVVNPNNAWTSNELSADFNNGGDTEDYGTFGLSVPGGATINGIEVSLEGRIAGGGRTMNVSLSGDNGGSFTSVKNQAFVGTETTYILGGPTNNWSATWSPDNCTNANFRVRLTTTAGGGDLYIDQLQVKVHYTTTTPTTLAVDAASGTYGGTCDLTATLSPAVADKTIDFYINGEYKGSDNTDVSGVATLTGVSLSVGADFLYAGTYTGTYNSSGVGADFAGDAEYDPSSGAADLTVNQKALTITGLAGINKVYDGNAIADVDPSAAVLNGVVGSDNVTVDATGATANFDDKHVGTGKTITVTGLVLTGAHAGNYYLVDPTATADITARPIEITADSQARTYGNADPALTWTVTSGGLVGTDNFTGALDRDAGENVGFYAITQGTLDISDGNGGNNYDLTFVNGQLEITPRDIEATPDNQSKIYGDSDPTFTWTVTSGDLVGTDNFTGALGRDPGEAVGSYSITQGTLAIDDGNSGLNYNLTFVSGVQFFIQYKILTITGLTADNKVYDGTTLATIDPSGAVLNGVVGSDNVTVDYSGASANFDNRNVGSGKTVTIIGLVLTGADAGNYGLAQPTATADITLRSIEITADNLTKIYGDADPSLTWTITSGSLGTGDSITGALARDAGETVGLYAVTQSSLAISDGNGGNNYDLTFVNGQLEITQKALTITGIVGYDKVYDGTTVAWVDYTGAWLLGIVGSDNVTATDTLALPTFADKNVGTGKTVTVTGLILVGADAGNYYLVDPTTTASITAATLTITAQPNTKIYDGNISASATPTVVGLQGTDTVTGLSETYDNPNVGTGKTLSVATYTVNDGNGGNNYNVILVTDSAGVINPAGLTITANNRAKTYGDAVTFAGTEFTATGLVGSDTVTSVTLASTGAAASATVAGSPYTIVPSAAVGTGLSNYTITYVNSTLTVNPKALTITANNRAKTYGDAVTFAGTEFTATGLVNADTATSVTLTSTGAGAAAAVGTYPIVPSAAVGTGLANYTITYVNGTLTVDPKALTITADNRAKTYGDVVTFAGTEFTATGLIGTDNVTSVTLASTGTAATAAAGTHAIVASEAAGTGLDNYAITYLDGTLTVNTRALTITASNRTKTYGDTITFTGTEFTATGLVNADTATGVTLTSAGTAASAAVAGSPYAIVPSAALGTGLGNYTITYVNGALTVTKGSGGCTVSSSVATTKHGKTVTLTATVTGTGATGTVTFQDGDTVLGTGTLSDGTATYSTSDLSAGSHFITAVYSGDDNFAGSSSPAITLTVKKAGGINWWLIIGLILGALAVALFFFFLIFFGRRRKKDEGKQTA